MARILICNADGSVSVTAELAECETATKLVAALPLEGTANVWGDEIYFRIPLSVRLAPDARQDMQVGELGYWPPGKAFCVFFGPTPVSDSDQPRAYSPVNPFGRVAGDATVFRKVQDGTRVHVTLVNG